MNTTDMNHVQVARNITDRETTARRKKALNRWSVLSIISFCLSLGLIVIALIQTIKADGDFGPLFGLLFILPSGIITAVASGISLISVRLGYKDTGIFKCCTVCFFIIGVLSVVSIVGTAVLAILFNYGVVALNPIVVCVCILLSGLITTAMVMVCFHCTIFFHTKSVKGEGERFHMQQSGSQVIQADSQQATGFKDQIEYQPVANIYQQERGSAMAVPQGQGQIPTPLSLGQDFASHRDTIPGASNIKSQGQAPTSFTHGQNSASHSGIILESSITQELHPIETEIRAYED